MHKTNVVFQLVNFCWLIYSIKGQESFERIRFTQEEQLTALNRNGVCLSVWSRLHADLWDDAWMDMFFKWMENTFLQSIARQCTRYNPCPLLAQLKVIIRIDGKNDVQNKKLVEPIEKLDENILYYTNHKPQKNIEEAIRKIVGASKCSWVSYVWIDADDVFLDGFFQYVTTEITKLIIKDQRVWRGALFVPKGIPFLVLGNNKCTVFEEREYSPSPFPFFCGVSSGQGLILKREVWDTLRFKVVPNFLHPNFLRVAREFVMKGIGYGEYTSLSCVQGHGHLGIGRDAEVYAYEKRDAADSGLFLIDLGSNWTTSGILLRTPFSGHFPWAFYDELPLCTRRQRAKIMKEFPRDVSYLLKAGDDLHISMKEACDNNRYLVPGVRKHIGCVELLPTISKEV